LEKLLLYVDVRESAKPVLWQNKIRETATPEGSPDPPAQPLKTRTVQRPYKSEIRKEIEKKKGAD
jgi:hypothetical protein